MRSSTETANELNEKVHEVLRRGFTRSELTALMPYEEYKNLLLINDHITYENHIISSGGAEVVTVVGVTVKPVEGIDKVYVCL